MTQVSWEMFPAMALMNQRKPQPQVLVQQLVQLVQLLQGQGHLPGMGKGQQSH